MLLDEIAQYLHAAGIVTYDPTGINGDCFISVLPSSPDNCVAIYPTGGYQADNKLGYDFPTVQIIVRGTQDPRPAYTRAQNIYDKMQNFYGQFVDGGTPILRCYGIQSGPIHLGADAKGRHEYSLNFELEVRNKTEHRE